MRRPKLTHVCMPRPAPVLPTAPTNPPPHPALSSQISSCVRSYPPASTSARALDSRGIPSLLLSPTPAGQPSFALPRMECARKGKTRVGPRNRKATPGRPPSRCAHDGRLAERDHADGGQRDQQRRLLLRQRPGMQASGRIWLGGLRPCQGHACRVFPWRRASGARSRLTGVSSLRLSQIGQR